MKIHPEPCRLCGADSLAFAHYCAKCQPTVLATFLHRVPSWKAPAVARRKRGEEKP